MSDVTSNCSQSQLDFMATVDQICMSVATFLTLTGGASSTIFALLFLSALTSLFTMNRLIRRAKKGYEEILGDADLTKTDTELVNSYKTPSHFFKHLGCRLYATLLFKIPLKSFR